MGRAAKAPTSSPTPATDKADNPPSAAKKKKSVSKAEKAGLLLSVSKVNNRIVQRKTTKRVGQTAPVYMAAVCEYFAAEIFELCVQRARKTTPTKSYNALGEKNKTPVRQITAADVCRVVRDDRALHKLVGGARILIGNKQSRADVADVITTSKDKRAKASAAGGERND
jgi:histone H3/H4